jgi:hypothetical protein
MSVFGTGEKQLQPGPAVTVEVEMEAPFFFSVK